MKYRTLEDIDLAGKRVLIRLDLNVPIQDGKITSTARIDLSVPTIRKAMEAGAKVMVMSHLGRPVEGQPEKRYSLGPVAECLSSALGREIRFVEDYLVSEPELDPGQAVLFENVRFNPGEKANDEALSRRYAGLCDVFVMDAFGAAHRMQSSTCGAGMFASEVCAGPLLSAELEALSAVVENPARPMAAIVGGSKVSTKLTLLESMLSTVDWLIPGGGIANTFLAASGIGVGQSLYEPELVDFAADLIRLADKNGKRILLPDDVAVADRFAADAAAVVKPVDDIGPKDMVLDIGPATSEKYRSVLDSAETIVWNGPMGVFEFDAFARGTRDIGQAVCSSGGFSGAGGGETLAAIERFDLADGISCISTGGGAFLEFLQGDSLPAVRMLESSA
ncbi:MAG: phosphoglycerate kinase [Gammaproteobacteria bacterium]|nr:phosphoglycerate kinase [Gammaproteobacteria bacterium]